MEPYPPGIGFAAPASSMANKKRREERIYAVVRGRVPGIYHSWDEASAQVLGFPQAKFKRFNSLEDAFVYTDMNGVGFGVSTTSF